MKTSNKLTIIKLRTPALTAALLTVLSVSNVATAASSSVWSCTAWKQDPVNSCVETKKCTRTLCDAKGKLDNCRIETKTSTATKANCTPSNTKPRASMFNQMTATQGVMAKPPSNKPARYGSAIGKHSAPQINAIKSTSNVKSKNVPSKIRMPALSKPTAGMKPVPAAKRTIKPVVKPSARTTKNPKLKPMTLPALTATPPGISVPYPNIDHKRNLQKPSIVIGNSIVLPTKKPNPKIHVTPVSGKGFVPVLSVSPTSSKRIGSGILENTLTNTGEIIKEASIPIAYLAAELQTAFQGTKIHLNNYGPRHNNSWYKGNDSFVQLPASLNGAKQSFSIPPMNKIPFRYYVKNTNLSSIQASESQDRLAVTFNFESSGKEIKGHCATGNLLKKALCVLGSDLSAPDIQMNNAKATVYLTPTLRNGSVSFSQVESDFSADIQAQGACDLAIVSHICNALFDYKNQIKGGVKSGLSAALDNNGVRDDIAFRLRVKLAQQGIKNLTEVSASNGYLNIKYRVILGQNAMH